MTEINTVDASGANPVLNVLDLVVLATVSRMVMENEVNSVFGPSGLSLLEAHRRLETNAGAAASEVIKPGQAEQLHQIIQESRQLAERAMYYTQRMPTLLNWQVQLLSLQLVNQPESRQILSDAERLTRSTETFARAGTHPDSAGWFGGGRPRLSDPGQQTPAGHSSIRAYKQRE